MLAKVVGPILTFARTQTVSCRVVNRDPNIWILGGISAMADRNLGIFAVARIRSTDLVNRVLIPIAVIRLFLGVTLV